MREYLTQLDAWRAQGKPFSIATVIHTWGSAPRPVGTMMFVGPGLEMLGSVSGGCVEGAILRESAATTAGNAPKYLRFGVSDNDAWSVGLTCGGSMEVFLEKFFADEAPEVWQSLHHCLTENKHCVLLTRLSEERGEHLLFLPDNQRLVGHADSESARFFQENAHRAWLERKNQTVESDGQQWFLRVFARKPQLLVFGAAHASAELVHLAHYFDFETIVIDPRSHFARNTHFPTPPGRLIDEYPAEVMNDFALDAYTFAVLMAHDPKIDDQALHALLRSEVAYIGALSSKRSHELRCERLRAAGFSDDDLKRIHAPVGLPIKSRTAQEIALSIMAQIVLTKNQHL